MAPRRYRIDTRRKAMEETRLRILEATVALHAEQGAVATSYAQIASRADVAVPTVYKYFPDLTALITACTGHVTAGAPALGPEIFDGSDGVEGRLHALVGAVFAQHRYLAPWMRHGLREAGAVPVLSEVMARGQADLRRLIALALAPHHGEKPPAALAALMESLLDFTAWQRLTEALPERTPEAATEAALLALVAAAANRSSFQQPAGRRRARS
jgi:AcrR family transcriptional regulator